jgi:hypothetical protein
VLLMTLQLFSLVTFLIGLLAWPADSLANCEFAEKRDAHYSRYEGFMGQLRNAGVAS